MKRVFLLLIATMLFAVTFGTANATVTFVTDRSSLGGNDYVNWGVLGPVNTFVSSPFSISSQAGLGMTVSLPTDQLTFGRVDQGSPSGGGGWFGNFAVGDKLLWTSPGIWNLNNGPITILFNSPVFAAGTQIQADYYDASLASIEALDSKGVVLGNFSLAGTGAGGDRIGDNSNIFVGIRSDTANISELILTMAHTDSSGNPTDFVINRLDIGNTAAVPLPGALLLFGPGLVGLAAIRRRFKK